MASLANDISCIRRVLHLNTVDQIVDEGIIVALLELYAADSQRVDLVLLELESMLGQQLEVGAQRKRYHFKWLI